jgi:hypothetical protein
MLRDVNTEVLINLNINAHQFIIAILLVNKYYDHLEKYLKESDSYDSFPDDLRRLSKKSLVAYQPDKEYNFKSIVVQPEFLRTLHKDDIFEELLLEYPMKVQRPDGVMAFLKRDKRLCKDLYYIITKDDRMKHEHIISCLKTELRHREASGTMQYMKTLQNWLSGREWENFEDLVANGTSAKQTDSYGTQLE